MKLKKIQADFFLKIFSNLEFAIFLLFLIGLASSLGSFIEQEEPLSFYQSNYPSQTPLLGFFTWKVIMNLGFDHVYRTWWFLGLLIFLGVSLLSCTLSRQSSILFRSKTLFVKKKKKSFFTLPFFIFLKRSSYFQEMISLKIQRMNFYTYQKKNLLYAYKGLIGRISPILVHISLILILSGGTVGAFQNFKAQEQIALGEMIHIQNPLGIGWFTSLPNYGIRINDFWVEYQEKKVHQFYSNLSLLDKFGNVIEEKSISVNNPLRYKNIDFYQSDWNLIGMRLKKEENIYEFPLFNLEKSKKTWITWVADQEKSYTLLFDQIENVFLIYNEKGMFLGKKEFNEFITKNSSLLQIIPSSGILIKYDLSIFLSYLGFFLLILTTLLSYFPFTQIWVLNLTSKSTFLIGATSNRGKIAVEIEFEDLINKIK
jgi:cytochrome c biogenesis protein